MPLNLLLFKETFKEGYVAVQKVIAIDGPSGSGKSTMAKSLASKLKLLYIDTGAMFRALGYYADQKKVSLNNSEDLESFLSTLSIKYGGGPKELIVIDGVNLTNKIREHHVSALASKISQIPVVREFLLRFQRSLVNDHICVMEGRDIGTVVFPQAFCKIFITATPEVRAKRRHTELQESGEDNVTYQKVLEDVIERDRLDTNREIAPLKVAEGAVVVDTSLLSPSDVLEKLCQTSFSKANENDLKL